MSGGTRGSGLRRGGPRGLVPTHAVMWEGGDTDHAVPVVRAALARFSNLRAVSLHRGFHSPANRALLDELPGVNALPKRGYLGKGDRECESEREFAALRKGRFLRSGLRPPLRKRPLRSPHNICWWLILTERRPPVPGDAHRSSIGVIYCFLRSQKSQSAHVSTRFSSVLQR